MKVRAAVAREPHKPFSMEELELADPRPEEVRVRLVASGICHADIIARDQDLPVPHPIVAGHEGAGVVEAVGSAVSAVAEGDRVVMSFSYCGHCHQCRRGRPAYCLENFPLNFGGARPDGTTSLTHGNELVHSHYFGQSSFATHAVVPAANLAVVDAEAPLALYAPLGCGVQTGAGAVLNSMRVPPGSGLAVFGTGSVGLSAIMAAHAIGVTTVIAVDVVPERLALAERLGATVTIDARSTQDVVGAIREVTGGQGVPFALDTTGRPTTIQTAVAALTATGELGLVAPGSATNEVTLGLLDLVMGRKVRGIQQGDSVPATFIPTLIELHRAGNFPLEEIVTTFPFEQLNEAAEAGLHGSAVKAVVLMDAA